MDRQNPLAMSRSGSISTYLEGLDLLYGSRLGSIVSNLSNLSKLIVFKGLGKLRSFVTKRRQGYSKFPSDERTVIYVDWSKINRQMDLAL